MMLNLRSIRASGDVKLLKNECNRLLEQECPNSWVKYGLALSELAVAHDMYGRIDLLGGNAASLQDLVDKLKACNISNDTLDIRYMNLILSVNVFSN